MRLSTVSLISGHRVCLIVCKGRPRVGTASPAKKTQLDPFIRSEISTGVKSVDKDFARIQTFVLDAMAPLSTLLDKGETLST